LQHLHLQQQQQQQQQQSLVAADCKLAVALRR
jgi:hypothetical protein